MPLLSEVNAHSRDKRIEFDEPTHVYTIDGEKGYTSVTTVVHSLFPEFKEDEVISKMMASRNWPQSKYFGMTREQIKNDWESNRSNAASLGTAMHANLESAYNGLEHETESKEWLLFKQYEADHLNLKPFRTEWTLFAKDIRVAGSVDMLYEDPDEPGALVLADWKRSKEIKTENKWQKGIHPLTKHLDDCNLNHYSLQLGIYKRLIQEYYGYKITQSFIVILHPNQDKYLKIITKDVDDIVEKLFEERKNALQVDELERDKENVPPLHKKVKLV